MKKMLFFILLSSSFACSDDTEENTPQLSFQIEDGPRFASSQVNVKNTSINYSGDFLWEVSSDYGTSQFTTENLSFEATRIGSHSITLSSSDGTFETKKTLFIPPPSLKILNKITLKETFKDYDGLYFKIQKYRPAQNSYSYVYTSEIKENVNASNASEIQWEISNEGLKIELVEPDLESFEAYTIELFNGSNELISRFDPFFNTFIETDEFINGEIPLLTTRMDCFDCDQFGILVDLSHGLK